MKIQELNQIIVESGNKSFFDNLTLTIDYSHLGFKNTFNGLGTIYEFVSRQVEGFTNLGELPPELNNVKKDFENCQKRLLQLFNSQNINQGEWDNAYSHLKVNRPAKFLYNFPETRFLIELYENKRESYPGAIEYFNGNLNNINNKNYFIGYISAYEFQSKSSSEIYKRKGSEKKSIERIRSDFQQLYEKSVQSTEDYISSTFEKLKTYSLSIDELKTDKDNLFSSWFDNQKSTYSSFFDASNKKVKDLESLYTKKLKLEAPARYWSQRAKKLRKEGMIWISSLIVSIGVTINILLNLLLSFSDGKLLKVFSNTGTAIKWSILLITTISFLAFAIKSLSKLTFSAFHLMRDAEEKEQLTYVYLALTKENGIDETERHLVMQSLFSRADTGLLKDDTSPTMPGNVLEKAINRP